MTANPVEHDHSKHVAVDYYFVRKRVADGYLVVRYIPSSLQTADVFIKGLSTQQSLFLKAKLSMHPSD